MNSIKKDASDVAVAHSKFAVMLQKLTIDEVRYVRRQFQIGNVSGKDRESDLFALLAKFSGKRTDGDAIKERLGISADSSITELLQELELGDTAGSSDTARQVVEWCDEVLRFR